MTTGTIAASAPASARRVPRVSALLDALRRDCAALVAGKLDARERYLAQACDRDDLVVREHSWQAYECSIATLARSG